MPYQILFSTLLFATPKVDDLIQLGVSQNVAKLSLKAHAKAKATNKKVYTIIDYTMTSDQKRMWVIDMTTGKALFHTKVAHGKGSDKNHDGKMDGVSNKNGSNATSLGMFVTAETYYGKHGYSLRLDGLEKGFNDLARERFIVIHPAKYMNKEWFKKHTYSGRSNGCPALPPTVSKSLIDTIKDGSLIFSYYADATWLKTSTYLQ